LVTLRYDTAASIEVPAKSPLIGSLAGRPADATRLETTVEYWLGRYDAVVETRGGDTDPDVLFVAANAAYRAARYGRTVGPDAARQLDPVLRAYASVLRADWRYTDAAYNLEYVSRLRNQLAGMKPAAAPPSRGLPPPPGPIETADLPAGPTVHGLPGSPPPPVKVEEFEVLKPRGFEDREADPEQAPGSRMRRKG
jgi:hypothetical protein